MTKAIVVAILLVEALAACAQYPVQPPAVAADNLTSGFVPYCGLIWSVGKQGYVDIPCPEGSNYPGAR